MHGSKDFKDSESMHSGQLSHVSSESALLLLQDERGDLLGRAKFVQPNIWDMPFTSGDVCASPPTHPSSSYTRIPAPWDPPDAGRIPERTSTGQLVLEDGDGGNGAIPNPSFQ